MDTRSRSAESSAPTMDVQQITEPRELRRTGRRGGWPWMIVGVGVVLLKAEAFAGLRNHRVWVIVILGLGLVSSVLRTRPVGIALTAGPLFAFALAPGSTALGIAVGIGVFVLLLALFFAVGTVLMARQHHGWSRAGGSELSRP